MVHDPWSMIHGPITGDRWMITDTKKKKKKYNNREVSFLYCYMHVVDAGAFDATQGRGEVNKGSIWNGLNTLHGTKEGISLTVAINAAVSRSIAPPSCIKMVALHMSNKRKKERKKGKNGRKKKAMLRAMRVKMKSGGQKSEV